MLWNFFSFRHAAAICFYVIKYFCCIFFKNVCQIFSYCLWVDLGNFEHAEKINSSFVMSECEVRVGVC